MYKSVKSTTIIKSEFITSSEVIHSVGDLQVWISHGKDQIFLFLEKHWSSLEQASSQWM